MDDRVARIRAGDLFDLALLKTVRGCGTAVAAIKRARAEEHLAIGKAKTDFAKKLHLARIESLDVLREEVTDIKRKLAMQEDKDGRFSFGATFVSVAKRVLDADTFRQIEVATEERLASLRTRAAAGEVGSAVPVVGAVATPRERRVG